MHVFLPSDMLMSWLGVNGEKPRFVVMMFGKIDYPIPTLTIYGQRIFFHV